MQKIAFVSDVFDLFYRGVQNQTDPIKNHKPNLTKPKTAKTAFGSDWFGPLYDRTARFGSVCGLYFETKPNRIIYNPFNLHQTQAHF